MAAIQMTRVGNVVYAFEPPSSPFSGTGFSEAVNDENEFPIVDKITNLFNGKRRWFDVVDSKLNAVCRLPKGWDSASGTPVAFTTAYFARQLLEDLYHDTLIIPQIVPCADGALQLEWHKRARSVEVLIEKPNLVHCYAEFEDSDAEEEFVCRSDFRRLSNLLARYTS